jgi:hypothetical protein
VLVVVAFVDASSCCVTFFVFFEVMVLVMRTWFGVTDGKNV